MTYVHIIILIAALQVADIATTVYILRTGIGYEANPIMRKLIEKLGSAKSKSTDRCNQNKGEPCRTTTEMR